MSDNVNHPPHYASGKIECIDAIESALGSYQFQNYCRGQVFKYLWRMDKKGNALEDSLKAQFYLERMVKSMQVDLGVPSKDLGR